MPFMDDFQAQIIDRLARIDTKLDTEIRQHDLRISSLEKRVPDADHETRLRKLERAVWVAAGAGSAGGGIVGLIVSQMTGA